MSDNNTNSIAFVATSTIPESPPPANETGPIKWVREILFSNIPN
jgi:general L-amino acid transport system permease protein